MVGGDVEHIVVAKVGHCGRRILPFGPTISPKRPEVDLVLGDVLATGSSGEVCAATRRSDGRAVAVKRLVKRGATEQQWRELLGEVDVHMSLDHPHVVRLDRVYETEADIYLQMELLQGGEVFDRLSDSGRYSEDEAAEAARQMLLAVAYLHNRRVAHRDLKLENFMYERSGGRVLKLIDFGFAQRVSDSEDGGFMTHLCGSLHYMAPEVLDRRYTEKADMWSFGVIVFVLLCGAMPWFDPAPSAGNADADIERRIRSDGPVYPAAFGRLTPAARELVLSLLARSADDRPSAAATLQHRWLESARAAASADRSVARSLRGFAGASPLRRAVLLLAARSLRPGASERARAHFLEADTDARGVLRREELARMLERGRGDGVAESEAAAEAESLFSRLDTDGSGEITYSEFVAASLYGRSRLAEEVALIAFCAFDAEGCGSVSVAGVRRVLGNEFEGFDAEELVGEADNDGDGVFSFNDLCSFVGQGAPRDSESDDGTPESVQQKPAAAIVEFVHEEGCTEFGSTFELVFRILAVFADAFFQVLFGTDVAGASQWVEAPSVEAVPKRAYQTGTVLMLAGAYMFRTMQFLA